VNARTIAGRLRQGLAWGLLVAGGLGGFALGLGPREGRPAALPLPPAAASAASAAGPAAAHAVAPPAISSAVALAASRAATRPVTGAAAPDVIGPARAAASAAALALPARGACIPDPADPDRCGPLTLERNPVTLPPASLGRAYAHAIQAEGGQPPYRFDLVEGSLPGGLTLDDRGRLAGMPGKSGSSRFRVRVVDAAGGVAAQTYSLRVGPSARPASSAASPGAPASAPPLGLVDLSRPVPSANATPTARVYQLDAAQLDALKGAIGSTDAPADASPPEATAAPADPSASAVEPAAAASVPALPVDLAWSDAQQAQLEAMLKRVVAVEYPSRSLFEAAVDTQVCAQARQLIAHEAQRLHQQPPRAWEVEERCRQLANAPAPAPKGARVASSPAAGAASTAGAEHVGWRDLPGWLMPPGLRDWLADAAARDRPLLPDKPPPWTATPSCNCAAPRPQQPLYALYPAWLADGPQPQALDFSLINRITYLALPLGEDLTPDQPGYWNEARTAFIRTAKAHETRVDFGIYRADWGFLNTEPASAREDTIQRYVQQFPAQARALLDTPLPGIRSQAKAWLPGFGAVQRLGDGLTVYFDQVPDADHDKELARRFTDFYPRFVQGLADAMRKNRTREYAINLVMTDSQFLHAGPFEAPRLFDLLKAVEDPEMADGRIVETNGDYKRNSNVELRFLILLSEPTIDSEKKLRMLIEAMLQAGNQRVFLRSVVPVLVLPQASPQQYRDDVVYVQDNFGGLAFWPAPLMGQHFDAAQAKVLRANFGPDPGAGVGDAVCGVVCPNRWLFRLAFELLLLAWAVWFALLQWRCEWRSRYGRYSLLGGIPPLLTGAALLQCDPALEALRKGNAQLIALIAIPSLAALWVLLRRKEDKP
jgi:hypothetical protein